MIKYNGLEVIPKYNGNSFVKMIQNGVTLWEEVIKSYIINLYHRYESNITVTVNSTSVKVPGRRDYDLSSYAPITTLKFSSSDGISKLPYLGDCTEIQCAGSTAYPTYMPDVNTKKCKKMDFSYITSFDGLDFDSITSLSLGWNSVINYAVIRNLGKSTMTTYNFREIENWNDSRYEQSLLDSLITNSYDRAAAGMEPATITLYSGVFNALNSTEKAQITAKGFTLTQ